MATKRYNFKFHCLKDKDIIDRIDSQENKQNYIRGLILSDIAADILRKNIKLEDFKSDLNSIYGKTVDLHDPCKHCPGNDDDDPDPGMCIGCPHNDRVITYDEWMEKNCKAFNNADEKCDGCPWSVKYLDDDNQIKIQCNADTAYDEYVEEWKHGKLQQS